jgi:mono/diheme cytochrome c family protein
VQSDDPTTLVRVVLQGTRAASTDSMPSAPAMPAFGWRVVDSQSAAVLTYIRNSWGNAAPPVAASTIAKQRTSFAAAPYH